MREIRAAVLEQSGGLKVDALSIEEPRPTEVLVRVSDCGVCHSDYGYIDGSFPGAYPVVLGHEAAGTIEAVGDAVEGLAPGDRVVLCPLPSCGHCYFCVRSQPTLCAKYSLSLYTATRPDGSSPYSRQGEMVYRGVGIGGWSEYTVVPQEAAVKVADDVDLAEACVIGCAVQTGVGAVLNTAAVETGATVLVTGAGGIGIAVTQGARLAGASVIVVADPVAERREAALRFGATHAIDPGETDVPSFCHDITAGIGVDYSFEAAGLAVLIEQGLLATRTGGTTVCIGAPPLDQGISIPTASAFVIGEKRLQGCALGSVNAHRDIPRLLDLARIGRIDLAGMITDRFDLDHVEDAVANLRDRKGIRTALSIG
ncbi:MAG TPA: Zn-dependent alcohol dehydrogenase [Acidimicrobiales bacterium]|jgi:Zn-dependent alcohol dehydrogenase